MPKFGNYAAKKFLCKSKMNPDFWWMFKEPSVGDDIEIEKLLKREFILGKNEFVVKANHFDIEIAYKQIAATFSSTNVQSDVFDGPFISPETPREIAEDALRNTYQIFVIELWEAVKYIRPGWGPIAKKYKIEIV